MKNYTIGIFMKNNFLKMTILFICFSSLSCATAKIITGPDGTAHQLVSCGSIEACYEKSTEVCGGKYKIVNTSTETSGDSKNTTSSTTLLIKCGG